MTTHESTTLTPAALAARWGCSTGTLANQRSAGRGPAYSRPMGRVIYLLADIEASEAATRVATLESAA